MAVYYEWDIEIRSLDGDIIEHYFADKLKEYKPEHFECEPDELAILTLVRRDENSGFVDWAYVNGSTLPDEFCDAENRPLMYIRVPKRFKKEFENNYQRLIEYGMAIK